MFQERHIFDLLVEFKLDVFEKEPLQAHVNEKGDIQLQDTGDDMIDRWEAQIASGELPNLYEAFDEESISNLEKLRKAKSRADTAYDGLSMKDMFDKIQREANAQGLTVGRTTTVAGASLAAAQEKQRLLEELFNKTTFGGGLDDL